MVNKGFQLILFRVLRDNFVRLRARFLYLLYPLRTHPVPWAADSQLDQSHVHCHCLFAVQAHQSQKEQNYINFYDDLKSKNLIEDDQDWPNCSCPDEKRINNWPFEPKYTWKITVAHSAHFGQYIWTTTEDPENLAVIIIYIYFDLTRTLITFVPISVTNALISIDLPHPLGPYKIARRPIDTFDMANRLGYCMEYGGGGNRLW